MTFDGFFMHHMNQELIHSLVSGRVNKIYQPSEREIIFTLRANRQNQKFYMSIDPTAPRYHLTNETFFNPDIAPNFCMILRKHLEGAILTTIQQIDMDRITTFIFKKIDELGDEQQYHLTVELMGRHSNIFLVNPKTNTIIDCLKHVSPLKNSFRSVRPNAVYVLPPIQQKKNIQTFNQYDELATLTDAKELAVLFHGIGKSTLHWVTQHIASGLSITQVIQKLQNENTMPTKIGNDFYPIALDSEETQTYDSLSQLLENFYAEKSKIDRFNQLSGNLLSHLQQLFSRLTLKLSRLQDDLNQAQSAEDFRIKGELLTTYAYQVNKGSATVILPNFYANEAPLIISLKPEKSAMQNAQDYFKKYQKNKQAVGFITEQIQTTRDELAYIDSVLVQIQLADTPTLASIKEELTQTGYFKQKSTFKRQKSHTKLEPMSFFSEDGTRILVGRNNLQNDELTFKMAKKTYYWLHAKDIPGSHVIVLSDTPTQDTLVQAAMLAAYYSKFQASANVPVDYTRIKHIKKPNGAKPGFVIYENQKTLFVSPTKEFINNHLARLQS